MSRDFSVIDNSMLLSYLFYPRRQRSKPPAEAFDLAVKVDEGVEIVCRAHPAGLKDPWILFFHGNGEIYSDYDQIASEYTGRGLGLMVADYRGYGASGGKPSFKALVEDAHRIALAARTELAALGNSGDWVVMGRSMGSVCALELSAAEGNSFAGVIFESGFIDVSKLIRHLGLPSPGNLSALEEESRRLAAAVKLPALIIHGEQDRLVPLEQGEELYKMLGSEEKELFTIPRADHNNIFYVGFKDYMEKVANFCHPG